MSSRVYEAARRGLAQAAWQAHPGQPRALYRLLRASQWWDPEELRALQAHAARELLGTARAVPFYRRRLAAAALEAEELSSVDDLRALPPLDRAEVQAEGAAGLGVPGRRGLRMTTSGSTGRPVEVLWSREWMAWHEAAVRRSNDWRGVRLGEHRLTIAGAVAGRRPRRRLSSALGNVTLGRTDQLGDPDFARALAGTLATRPPAIVTGLASGLYLLSTTLLAQGLSVRARACWSGGDHLQDIYREAIERAFGCRVLERYSANETGPVAQQCPEAGAFHVAAEGVVVENVQADGSATPPGEIGELLVTCLRNRAMPLIRYRIGDMAVAPQPGRCACGRGLPLLGRLVGSSNEMLISADGRPIVTPRVSAVITAVAASVVEFRIVQRPDLSVEVQVVQREDPPGGPVRERIAGSLDRLVGRPGATTVERVPEIPLSTAGKLRHIVSEASAGVVASGQPDDQDGQRSNQ